MSFLIDVILIADLPLQVHFNVFASPKKGQNWGAFSVDLENLPIGQTGGPNYHEDVPGKHASASKVSEVGDSSGSVLLARLREDLTGKGAFRRFARTLRRHEELMHEWLRMKDDRAVARAGEWLAQEGLLADPTVPPTAPPRVE